MINGIRVATRINGEPSQLKNGLRGPPYELILFVPSTLKLLFKIQAASNGEAFKFFAGGKWNKELEAGFELLGNERVDRGGAGGGTNEREEIGGCGFWDGR